ncbi:hypothetical protein LSM04_001393 [Trypanosoma melophagium]|uniref:uncharacterized protein n=1 Tax=Trypanosoma melophagium TaxID=715481 RepID=UPI00351A01FA|nr:hypothetical protein LSM04_001393 [Trypanosoma melophagium]
MNGLAKEMHSLSNEIEEHRRNLSSEISFCERYNVHTRTLAAGNIKLAEELGDWLTAWRAKGGTEGMFREQLGLEIERTNVAVRKTKEAVARIRVTAKNTSDAVDKLKTVYKKFQSDRDEYMTLYYVMGIEGFDAEKYGVATRSKERLERALGVIKSADECSKTALQCAAGAEEGANMAGNATTLLNEKVNKILPPSEETPTHGRQEATTGQPSGELGDVSPTVAKDGSRSPALSHSPLLLLVLLCVLGCTLVC